MTSTNPTQEKSRTTIRDLHNALIYVRSSMSHPRMDSHNQLSECIERILRITNNTTLTMLRELYHPVTTSALHNALSEIAHWPHPSICADGSLCKKSDYAAGLANVRRFARDALDPSTIRAENINMDNITFVPYCSYCLEPAVYETPLRDTYICDDPECHRNFVRTESTRLFEK